MIWPPSLLRLRFQEAGKRRWNLWLPVLLIWPFLMVAAVLLLPVGLVALVKCGPRGSWMLLRGAFRGFVLFCALRGLHVEVHDEDSDLLVQLI